MNDHASLIAKINQEIRQSLKTALRSFVWNFFAVFLYGAGIAAATFYVRAKLKSIQSATSSPRGLTISSFKNLARTQIALRS